MLLLPKPPIPYDGGGAEPGTGAEDPVAAAGLPNPPLPAPLDPNMENPPLPPKTPVLTNRLPLSAAATPGAAGADVERPPGAEPKGALTNRRPIWDVAAFTFDEFAAFLAPPSVTPEFIACGNHDVVPTGIRGLPPRALGPARAPLPNMDLSRFEPISLAFSGEDLVLTGTASALPSPPFTGAFPGDLVVAAAVVGVAATEEEGTAEDPSALLSDVFANAIRLDVTPVPRLGEFDLVLAESISCCERPPPLPATSSTLPLLLPLRPASSFFSGTREADTCRLFCCEVARVCLVCWLLLLTLESLVVAVAAVAAPGEDRFQALCALRGTDHALTRGFGAAAVARVAVDPLLAPTPVLAPRAFEPELELVREPTLAPLRRSLLELPLVPLSSRRPPRRVPEEDADLWA